MNLISSKLSGSSDSNFIITEF